MRHVVTSCAAIVTADFDGCCQAGRPWLGARVPIGREATNSGTGPRSADGNQVSLFVAGSSRRTAVGKCRGKCQREPASDPIRIRAVPGRKEGE